MTQNKEDRDIARAFYNTYQGGHWILGAGSAYAGWYFTNTLGGRLFGEYTIYAAVAAGLFAYYLLDNQVLKFAPRAIAFILSWFGVKGKAAQVNQKSRANQIFDVMIVVVFALMLTASFYSNTIIVPDISGEITGDADTDTEKRSMGGNNATYERELTGYESQVKTAQEAVLAATAAKDADINSAANSELRRLAAKGNDWAKNEIRKLQASASRKHDRIIRKAESALMSAQKEKNAFVSSQGGKVKDTNKLLAGVVQNKEAKHENRFSRWNNWFNIVMYVGLFLFIFGAIGFQCYQIDTGDSVVSDITTGKVLGAFKAKAGRGANTGLARVLGVRDRVNFGPGSPSVRVQSNGTMAIDARQGAPLFPRSEQAANAWTRDAQKQGARFPETGQNTEGQNFGDRNTETQKHRTQNTETRTEQDRTENRTEDKSGVGEEWPIPSNADEWKNFLKKVRQWNIQSSVAKDANTRVVNATKVKRAVNHIESFGYKVVIDQAGGNMSIYKTLRDEKFKEVEAEDFEVVYEVGTATRQKIEE